MPNASLKTRKLPDYAVRFVGYSARIMPVKETPSTRIWILFSGAAAIFAGEGRLLVTKRLVLPSAVAELPLCVPELKSLLKSITLDGDGSDIVLRRGRSRNLRQSRR